MAGPKTLNFHARPWAPEEDAVLLRHANAASTPWQGCAAAGVALGRSTKACYQRYVKLKGRAPEAPAHLALHRLARVKGRLGARDIEQVARATGLHYHAALSTLASLHARGAIAGPCPGCPDLKARDEEIVRLSAEVTRLEQLLREAEREAGALRARVAEFEAKLGVGVDPLAGELTHHQESVALAGQILFRYALEKRSALPAPGICELAGRFDLARCKLEHALADLAAGRDTLSEARKWQAFLNASVERLVTESLRIKTIKIPKTQKEVV
jgi:hypothetical protein